MSRELTLAPVELGRVELDRIVTVITVLGSIQPDQSSSFDLDRIGCCDYTLSVTVLVQCTGCNCYCLTSLTGFALIRALSYILTYLLTYLLIYLLFALLYSAFIIRIML